MSTKHVAILSEDWSFSRNVFSRSEKRSCFLIILKTRYQKPQYHCDVTHEPFDFRTEHKIVRFEYRRTKANQIRTECVRAPVPDFLL